MDSRSIAVSGILEDGTPLLGSPPRFGSGRFLHIDSQLDEYSDGILFASFHLDVLKYLDESLLGNPLGISSVVRS